MDRGDHHPHLRRGGVVTDFDAETRDALRDLCLAVAIGGDDE